MAIDTCIDSSLREGCVQIFKPIFQKMANNFTKKVVISKQKYLMPLTKDKSPHITMHYVHRKKTKILSFKTNLREKRNKYKSRS